MPLNVVYQALVQCKACRLKSDFISQLLSLGLFLFQVYVSSAWVSPWRWNIHEVVKFDSKKSFKAIIQNTVINNQWYRVVFYIIVNNQLGTWRYPSCNSASSCLWPRMKSMRTLQTKILLCSLWVVGRLDYLFEQGTTLIVPGVASFRGWHSSWISLSCWFFFSLV